MLSEVLHVCMSGDFMTLLYDSEHKATSLLVEGEEGAPLHSHTLNLAVYPLSHVLAVGSLDA